MDCVTYKNVIRTSPGRAYAHKRTYDGEIEAPTLVPSHRHVKNGVTTGKITRCVGDPRKVLHTHTHTHTHFQVQGLEKGVSENEAPGPIGAYTTTHNDTITLMPNLIHRISFTESHSHN